MDKRRRSSGGHRQIYTFRGQVKFQLILFKIRMVDSLTNKRRNFFGNGNYSEVGNTKPVIEGRFGKTAANPVKDHEDKT